MNKETNRKIKVEATTGEVYFDYSERPDHKIDSRFRRIALWFSNHLNAHFDRLSVLRVYDHRRIDG